jgi:hypothetical protein
MMHSAIYTVWFTKDCRNFNPWCSCVHRLLKKNGTHLNEKLTLFAFLKFPRNRLELSWRLLLPILWLLINLCMILCNESECGFCVPAPLSFLFFLFFYNMFLRHLFWCLLLILLFYAFLKWKKKKTNKTSIIVIYVSRPKSIWVWVFWPRRSRGFKIG